MRYYNGLKPIFPKKKPLKKLNHIIVFSDNKAGHEIQSLALAQAMANTVELYHCAIRQPWLSFCPRILPRFGRNIIWQKQKPNKKTTPNAIITCGRSMAAVGKYYKRKHNCHHIHILNPRDNPKKYDLLICPEHDQITGKNILTTQGSLHPINPQMLKQEKKITATKLIALMLGNPNPKFYQQLPKLAQLIKHKLPPYQLFICTSRRTDSRYQAQIQQTFPNARHWFTPQDGNNPYRPLLASAEILLITADSINMLSEACATEKPVIALAQDHLPAKHHRFLRSIATRLSSFEHIKTQNPALNTLQHVTQQALAHLKKIK